MNRYSSSLNYTPYIHVFVKAHGSIPVRGRIFFFSTTPRPALRPTQPSVPWVLRAISPEVKRPGRDPDHSTPSIAEVKNGGAIFPLPRMSSCHSTQWVKSKVSVGTANINSSPGQSQFRSYPMLSIGWINAFPQQRSHPRSVSMISSSSERSNPIVERGVYYSGRTQLLKADWYVYRRH
jgi:hypothetical protein